MTQINLTFDPGTSLNQILAFKTAAKAWEHHLQDDATVNIHVGVTSASNFARGVIGGALPGMRPSTSYGEFRNRYRQDVTSTDDATANDRMSSSANWVKYEQVNFNGDNLGEYTSSSVMSMTRANAKALGLNLNNAQELDGYILMSDLQGQGVQWDHHAQRVNGIDASALDFMTTAMHEIGHVLGFVSGVDESGWLAAEVNSVQGQDYMQTWQNTTQSLRDRVRHANPLDLFRYSNNSNGLPDLTYGSQFSDKYFSIDGGQTEIVQFSSGSDDSAGGDGYQASHWKLDDGVEAIMRPALEQGTRGNISPLDLRAMDVIGWDISSNSTSTPINFTAFFNQAKQEVANQAGRSKRWVDRNPNAAAARVTQDRGDDLFQMLESSQYDMSWLNPWATGGGSRFHAWQNFWASGGSQRFQMLGQVFQQEARFSTLDEVIPAESNSETALSENRADSLTPTSVPETADPLLQAPISVGTGIESSIISTASSELSAAQVSTQTGITPESLQDNELGPLEQDDALVSLGSTPTTAETLLPTVPENILADPLGGLGSDQLLGNGLSGLVTL